MVGYLLKRQLDVYQGRYGLYGIGVLSMFNEESVTRLKPRVPLEDIKLGFLKGLRNGFVSLVPAHIRHRHRCWSINIENELTC